jgi:hypothetical protein
MNIGLFQIVLWSEEGKNILNTRISRSFMTVLVIGLLGHFWQLTNMECGRIPAFVWSQKMIVSLARSLPFELQLGINTHTLQLVTQEPQYSWTFYHVKAAQALPQKHLMPIV